MFSLTIEGFYTLSIKSSVTQGANTFALKLAYSCKNRPRLVCVRVENVFGGGNRQRLLHMMILNLVLPEVVRVLVTIS